MLLQSALASRAHLLACRRHAACVRLVHIAGNGWKRKRCSVIGRKRNVCQVAGGCTQNQRQRLAGFMIVGEHVRGSHMMQVKALCLVRACIARQSAAFSTREGSELQVSSARPEFSRDARGKVRWATARKAGRGGAMLHVRRAAPAMPLPRVTPSIRDPLGDEPTAASTVVCSGPDTGPRAEVG